MYQAIVTLALMFTFPAYAECEQELTSILKKESVEDIYNKIGCLGSNEQIGQA